MTEQVLQATKEEDEL